VICILKKFTANNYIWKSINTFGSPPIDAVLPNLKFVLCTSFKHLKCLKISSVHNNTRNTEGNAIRVRNRITLTFLRRDVSLNATILNKWVCLNNLLSIYSVYNNQTEWSEGMFWEQTQFIKILNQVQKLYHKFYVFYYLQGGQGREILY